MNNIRAGNRSQWLPAPNQNHKPMKVIKVCINPTCGDVAHNCPKNETRCRNCDYRLVEINKELYIRKYLFDPCQIDYDTDQFTCAKDQGFDVQMQLF